MSQANTMAYTQEQLETLWNAVQRCVLLIPDDRCSKCDCPMPECFKKHFFEEMTTESYTDYTEMIESHDLFTRLEKYKKTRKMRPIPKNAKFFSIQIRDGNDTKVLFDLVDANVHLMHQENKGSDCYYVVKTSRLRMAKLIACRHDWFIKCHENYAQ